MCHVLIIEDEWLIAEYLRDLVEQAGASTVDFARTEAEAIEAACRTLPAVILSDVRLAEGFGPSAVHLIVQKVRPVPTIFITGNPEECPPCEAAVAVLSKPIVDDDVMATFRRFAPT